MSSAAALRQKPHLSGVIAAMLTPMQDGGSRVDLPATGRLVAWLIEQGIHGLYIAGTTGEGLSLSPEEHQELARGGRAGGERHPGRRARGSADDGPSRDAGPPGLRGRGHGWRPSRRPITA